MKKAVILLVLGMVLACMTATAVNDEPGQDVGDVEEPGQNGNIWLDRLDDGDVEEPGQNGNPWDAEGEDS